MKLVLRFFGLLAVWTAAFMGLVLLSTLLSGGRDGILVLHITRWLAGALALAGFPAGIMVSRDFLSWSRPSVGRLMEFGVASLAIALIVFSVRGYLGPLAVRSAYPDTAVHPEVDPAALLFHERPAALEEAEARAMSAGADAAVADWLPANRIAWDLDGTITGSILAAVLAWLGLLVGAWARWAERRELRQAQYWLVGLFLLFTGYLMTENTYELIVLKMAGPAYVGPWLAILAPSMLLAGMAFPTAARLLGRWQAGPAGTLEANG